MKLTLIEILHHKVKEKNDRIFLNDDIPILEQYKALPKDQIYMGIKYFFPSIHVIEDRKCLMLIFHEVNKMFLSFSTNCSDELQIYEYSDNIFTGYCFGYDCFAGLL